jgi:hypothetical protein
MKRTLHFTWAAAAIVLITISGTLHAQEEDRHRCMVGGIYDDSTGSCRLAITMEFNYPDWIGDSYAFSGPVYELLLAERDEYMRWNDELFTPGAPRGHLKFTYEEFTHGESLRSVVFTVESDIGGVSPYIVFRSLTFDLERESVVTLDELFIEDTDILAALQPLVTAELEAQLGDTVSERSLTESTNELRDYHAWALTDEGLVFFFAPYTVTHETSDSFTVSIPVDNLSGVINPMLLP